MIGIYKITNKINDNSYIGLSVDIERRWKTHCQRYQDPNNKEYDKVLYKAFRKYGINNFSFEIIEECDAKQLQEKEKYWITFYDTYNHGYNATPGGDKVFDMSGEKHPNHKITEADVIYIRELWASKTISTREMYYEYKNRNAFILVSTSLVYKSSIELLDLLNAINKNKTIEKKFEKVI